MFSSRLVFVEHQARPSSSNSVVHEANIWNKLNCTRGKYLKSFNLGKDQFAAIRIWADIIIIGVLILFERGDWRPIWTHSWRSPDSRWRPPYLHWRPPDFRRRPPHFNCRRESWVPNDDDLFPDYKKSISLYACNLMCSYLKLKIEQLCSKKKVWNSRGLHHQVANK